MPAFDANRIVSAMQETVFFGGLVYLWRTQPETAVFCSGLLGALVSSVVTRRAAQRAGEAVAHGFSHRPPPGPPPPPPTGFTGAPPEWVGIAPPEGASAPPGGRSSPRWRFRRVAFPLASLGVAAVACGAPPAPPDPLALAYGAELSSCIDRAEALTDAGDDDARRAWSRACREATKERWAPVIAERRARRDAGGAP